MAPSSRPDPTSWKKSGSGVRFSPKPASGYRLGDFGNRGRSHRQLLFQVSALITLAVGLCVILAIFLQKRLDQDVPFIFVGVSEMKLRTATDPLFAPPNLAGGNDADWLSRRFKSSADQHVVFIGSPKTQTGTMAGTVDGRPRLLNVLQRDIENAIPGGPGGDMIAVYLTAHGIVAEPDETPYLITGDSLPGETANWVSMESVLSTLDNALAAKRESGQPGSVDARVVLFLDTARSGPIWDWGKWDDSFATCCQKLISQQPNPRVAVIVSCSSGERSRIDPRRGISLFARAVSEALTGESDRDGEENNVDQDGDRVFTIDEVTKFIRSQVADDANRLWAAPQTPQLISPVSTASWELILQPDKVPAQSRQSNVSDRLAERFAKIDSLWARHNVVANRPFSPLATTPLRWSVLEKKLARLDLLALAGDAGFGNLALECEVALTSLEADPARVFGRDIFSELAITERFFPAAGRDESFETFVAAWDEKPDPKAVKPPPKTTEAQLTGFFWGRLTGATAGPASWNDASEVLRQAGFGAESTLLETHLIHLLTAEDIPVSDSAAQSIAKSHQSSRKVLVTDDIRSSFWIASELAKDDLQRLRRTDEVLSGEDVRRLDQLTTEVYPKLQRDSEQIARAYRVRDRVLHGVPRITETLLADPMAFADEEKRSPTVGLIKKAHAAVAQLVQSVNLESATANLDRRTAMIDDVVQAADAAENAYENLRLRLHDRVDAAVKRDANDEGTLRKLDALLIGSGLDDASRRKAVHTRIVNLLADDSADKSALISATTRRDAEDTGPLIQIDGRHPWLHWLDSIESRPIDTSSSLVAQGTALREEAKAFRDFDDAGAVVSVFDRAKESGSVAKIRAELARLDTDCRARTFLITDEPDPVRAVTENRFRLDVQLFALQHANRTIDEFWCEARTGERPYFADAARQLLNWRLEPFAHLPASIDGEDIAERWGLAEQSAQHPETLLPNPPTEFQRGAIGTLVRGKPIVFSLRSPDGLDSGLVTVSSDRVVDQLRWDTKPANDLQTTVTAPSGELNESGFAVNTFFRGLRRRGGLQLRELGGGKTTRIRSPNYSTPTALVEPEPTDDENIVLVVDCSRSMLVGTRLDDARKALLGYVDKLSQRQPKVALVLFGHRYGWRQEGKFLVEDEEANRTLNNPLKDEKFYKVDHYSPDAAIREMPSLRLKDYSQPHHPDNDVQRVADLDTLTGQHLEYIEDALTGMKAGGVTPTYKSIKIAYDTLAKRSGHIIVVTDGEPLLTDNRPSDDREKAKDLFDSNPSIRLSIVNFASSDTQQELIETFSSRDDQAGLVVKARNGNELERQLNEMVETPQVVWKDASKIAGRPRDWGFVVEPSRWPPEDSEAERGRLVRPARQATIEVARSGELFSAKVWVEGGERFIFRMEDGKLLHVPFDRGRHIADGKLRAGQRSRYPDGSNFDVHMLKPNRNNGRQLKIQLVIENSDPTRFTPRPSEGWIELEGIGDSDQQRVRRQVSWLSFQDGQPVPVITAEVDWPAWATSVHCVAHFCMKPESRPGHSLGLTAGSGKTIAAIPSVTFDVESSDGARKYKVTQTHASGGPIDDLLAIHLEPPPNVVTTTTYESEPIVTRVFEYDVAPERTPKATVRRKSEVIGDATLKVETISPIHVPD